MMQWRITCNKQYSQYLHCKYVIGHINIEAIRCYKMQSHCDSIGSVDVTLEIFDF
jgi:hypothetical protein